jgi:hypothetical protein
MISHEVPHQSFAETATQIAEYFNITERALLMSDTNKRYTHTQNACYSPSCPIQPNSYTTVIISPTADNIADIYNGFIYAEMVCSFDLTGSATAPTGGDGRCVTWVGFRNAMDAIEKYEILANGVSIYTQNNAIEESFITSCAMTDAIKTSDIYSRVRHEDIWNKKYGNQCGIWLDWKGVTSHLNQIIKLKIDLRNFLPLSNIKYLPVFAGKIELKLFFSTKGLVVAVPDPYIGLGSVLSRSGYTMPAITGEFVQIGDPIMMIVAAPNLSSGAATWTADWRVVSVRDDRRIITCESLISCFGLHDSIYNTLVERYKTQALEFPTQILQVSTMSGDLKQANSKSSQTITPRFVDSIFLLFPLKVSHRSIFKNPGFDTFQLNCSGYGQIPAVAFGTVDEPRLLEMCSNAVNLNTDTFGLNTEVLNSLIHFDSVDLFSGYRSINGTSFFIGIPTETDNTFQQGQTSNTPINYELTIHQDQTSSYATNVQSPPIMCLLCDASFSITVKPNGQPPTVSLGITDITSPVLVTK